MGSLKFLGAVLLAGVLAACGGGGGSPGTTSSGSGTQNPAPTTATASAASFVYQMDKTTINNSGSDKALLTVTALDTNNNPVSGVSVTVAVDSGVYTPISTTTDSSGQVAGAISIGGNKANRNITATIKVGAQTATVVVAVTGSQISLTPVPATPAPGATVNLSLKALDQNGTGVQNVSIQLAGTLGFNQTVTTDAGGNAVATLGAAPATPGTYSIEATGLGVSVVRSVQVVSSTGGGIPDATGTISAASLAIVPNTIAPNVAGSTANRAAVRAKFLNASNQAIQNVRVRFEIVPPGLGSGEQLSTGTATVYTDVNGEALTDYIAGTRSSPTDGVLIKACYGLTDASIASGACPNSVTKTMTVASQPVSITLGDNNELLKGSNNLTYIKKFDVAVADSAGNAVANAVVSASVDITHYGKGGYSYVSTTGGTTSTYQVTSDNTTVPTATTGRVWCFNEDTNRNGFLDTSPVNEDINFNGTLEPRKADVILSFLGSNTTGSNGRMAIQVEYPQNVATWLAYTVKVTTSVAGSEGTDMKSYVTSFVKGDDANGSFLVAPYGEKSCVDPN